MLYIVIILLFGIIILLLLAVVVVLQGLWRLLRAKRDGPLASRLRRVIKFMAQEGSLTAQEYCDYLGINDRQSSEDLKLLTDLGLVEKVGKKGKCFYRYIGSL